MTSYVALLRAVNVGGTGKLSMQHLVALCQQAGFTDVRTYLASGNAIFRSPLQEHAVRSALQEQLQHHAGKPVGLCIRSAADLARVVASNPFAQHPGNRVSVLFTDDPLSTTALDGATGRCSEEVALGQRELYIWYPDGMASTRLRLPADRSGTARNTNTVAKLADLAAQLTHPS